jgi:hypothetical protein
MCHSKCKKCGHIAAEDFSAGIPVYDFEFSQFVVVGQEDSKG